MNDSLEIIHQQQSSAVVEVEKQKGLGTVMAMIAVAKKFPRDQALALANLTRSCQRKGLAEISQYTYSRGGTEINGPSINLLRAVAQSWGNIQSGWQEVERRTGESTVRTWASDLESNTHEERTFIVRHWRDTKSGGYLLKDERDIYELLANQAARRLRGCLQGVIPQDIVELAVEECDRTLAKGGGVPMSDRIRFMVAKFSEIGVTKEQIEKKLGHNIEATKETELSKLGKVFNSIRDGVGTVQEHFPSIAETVADSKKVSPKMEPTVTAEYIPTETVQDPVQPEPVQRQLWEDLADFVKNQCGVSFDRMRDVLKDLGWNSKGHTPGMDDWDGFETMPSAAVNKIWNARRGLELHLKGKIE